MCPLGVLGNIPSGTFPDVEALCESPDESSIDHLSCGTARAVALSENVACQTVPGSILPKCYGA